MTLKTSIYFALFCFFFPGLEANLGAQATGSVKEAHPSGLSYSTETSAAVSPALSQEETSLRMALASQPDSPELLYELALVLRGEDKPRESLGAYTQAASLRTPTPAELRSVALDYVLLNDYDDAIHWLRVAARLGPTNIDVLYSLGRCYYSKGRYLDAEQMYDRVLAIDPKHVKAEEGLGLSYDATNQPDKAEHALHNAASWADQNGSDEWPFLDLGGFLLDQDRAKEALDPLRIAAHIQPACAACHEELGRALLAADEVAGAVSELQQAEQLDPANPKTHYELGRALRQAGQIKRAQEEFTLSQKLYGTNSYE
jgi:tetratricopeptide (TPR) repeat protein